MTVTDPGHQPQEIQHESARTSRRLRSDDVDGVRARALDHLATMNAGWLRRCPGLDLRHEARAPTHAPPVARPLRRAAGRGDPRRLEPSCPARRVTARASTVTASSQSVTRRHEPFSLATGTAGGASGRAASWRTARRGSVDAGVPAAAFATSRSTRTAPGDRMRAQRAWRTDWQV